MRVLAFGWCSAYMVARIDLEDDDATRTALEVDEHSARPDRAR